MVILWPNKWTKVKLEISEERNGIIRRIEISWNRSFKNGSYVIPRIIRKEQKIKT
jgi:hypothetical protein